MKSFKFLQHTSDRCGRLAWRGISIDGYKFSIHTDLSDTDIMVILRRISYEYQYVRMWDDHANRDRLLEFLQERFDNAVNVIDRDELIRNNGYIDRIIYE